MDKCGTSHPNYGTPLPQPDEKRLRNRKSKGR